MKINLISDLHLEVSTVDHKIPNDADIMILPGDISPVIKQTVNWIDESSDDKPVIYVAGNHEFYDYKFFPDHYDTLKNIENVCSNVKFLQNSVTIINGVRFIGATLWTDFNLDPNVTVGESLDKAPLIMNDYRFICSSDWNGQMSYKNAPVTPVEILNAYNESLKFIIDTLKNSFDGPTVIISHHGVSHQSIHESYKHLKNNEYFASDLSHIIEEYQPTAWVHGHTHQSLDYNIGDTRVIANPRGYATKNNAENKTFDKDFIFEIS